MKKDFMYEYESTPKRKFLNVVENLVNYALLFTFTGIIFSGVALTLIHLAFGV